MFARVHLRPLLLVLAAFSLLAASCASIATFVEENASVDQDPEPAATDPGEIALQPVRDDRIDFSLSRSDVNCTEEALTVVDDSTVWGAHYVVDGQLGKICYGRTSAVLVDAWKLLVEVTPPSELRKMSVMAGFSHNNNRGFRQVGVASMGAFDPGSQMSIDVEHAFSDRARLTKTLVHEMGHVISFARGQYSPTVSPAECPSFTDGSACYNWDSLMFEWVDAFWGPGVIDTYDPAVPPSAAVGRARCSSNAGFWNSYAASSPVEDIAESYAMFVLRKAPETAEQQAKHDWFAARPEMLAARARAEAWGHGPLGDYSPRCN